MRQVEKKEKKNFEPGKVQERRQKNEKISIFIYL